MVDNLAYGGDTLWGGTDACVGHPHSGGLFGSRDGTIVDFDGTNYLTGHTLRGTFGNWDASGNLTTNTSQIATYSYGSCALAYDGSTYKAYEVFQSNGYSLAETHEYDTYAAALAAAGNNTDLVRPRGYHYDWVAATQNPTAYYGGTYDANQSLINGICPTGWRLPTGGSTSAEWRQLFVAIGGRASGNGDSTERQYLLARWKTTTSGWSNRDNSIIYWLTTDGRWWSSTANGTDRAYLLDLATNAVGPEYINWNYREYGFNIRCVKN